MKKKESEKPKEQLHNKKEALQNLFLVSLFPYL